MKRTHKQLLALSTGALLTSTLLAPAQAQVASQDQLTQYFDKQTSTYGENIGGFTYDAANDTWWVATFVGTYQSIRKIIPDGNGGYMPQPLTNGTGDPEGGLVTSPDWLSFISSDDVAAGSFNPGWNRTNPTPGNILLNPKALTINGVSYAAGEIAFVNHAGTALQEVLENGDKVYHMDATKVLYTYDLREVFANQNAGGVDHDGNGRVDWNDVFTEHVNRDTYNLAAGADANSTSSANLARSFAWSTDGQSIYMNDTGRSFGGIYLVDATTPDTLTRIFDTTIAGDRINTEPGVLHTSVKSLTGETYTGDQLIVEGGGVSGNVGGIDVLVNADGGSQWEAVTLVDAATLQAFLGTESTPAVTSVTTDGDGNIYFTEAANDALYKLDTQGRLSKMASEREIESFQKAYSGANPSSGSLLDLQTRTVTHSGEAGSFEVTELLYSDAPFDVPIGVKAFKVGDFDRNNTVDQADIALFKSALQTVGTPGTSDATERFDLNGDAAGSNSSSTDAFSIVDYKDVKTLQQFYAFNNGDADMNQSVDFSDATTVVNNFGSTTATWIDGDFDGDDTVGFSDATTLVNNFATAPQLAAPLVNFDGLVEDGVAIAQADMSVAAMDVISLSVNPETGELVIEGDGLAISGFAISSASDSLVADADNQASPFTLYWINNASQVSASVLGGQVDLDEDGLLLDAAFAVNGLQDLVFEYALAGQAATTGIVTYVPEPASALLIGLGTVATLGRRRRQA